MTSASTVSVNLGNYYDKANIDGKIATLYTSIATKANSSALSNYYTTSQVDTALALKQNRSDLEANYYTKSQVDNRITSVASGGSVSLENYYTKSQIDTSLTAKQNVSDFNIAILNYFTKAEINTSLATKANSIDVYTKTESDTNYQRKLINPTLGAGQTSFINLATYKSKILQVSEPIEILYDDNRINLGLVESAVFNVANYYTKTQSDAKYRTIDDSFSITETYNRAEIDAKVGSIKSFSFFNINAVNFNNWCYFGYVNTDSFNFLAQTVRFEISTATNVRDTNNTQNVAYTILFKTTGSFSHFKQSDNPANTGNFYGNIVGFALSTNPNSVNTIDFRVTQITIGSSTRFKFYYRPNTGTQGKTIVVVHNENFVVANQTNIDTLPDEPIYLNTPFSYVSLSGVFLGVF